MERVAYVINSRLHTQDFIKGFLNKGLAMLSKAFPSAKPVWKASELYDQQLNDIGIVIAFGTMDDDDRQMRISWDHVFEICEKHAVRIICCGEICAGPEKIPAHMTLISDKAFLFMFNLHKEMERGLSINDPVCIAVDEKSDIRYMRCLADQFNYMTLVHASFKISGEMAEELYRYNGTAVRIAESVGDGRAFQKIFVFDSYTKKRYRYFAAQGTVCNLFEECKSCTEPAYTNKLDPLRLNESYLSAKFYIQHGFFAMDARNQIRKAAALRFTEQAVI